MNSPLNLFRCAFVLVGCVLAGVTSQPADLPLGGPDGSVVVKVSTEGFLAYTIESHGKLRIERSRLGIVMDGADLGASIQLGTPRTRTISETFPWRGNKALATNECETFEIPVQSKSAGMNWTLEVRVFNNGAAFRYLIPGNSRRRVNGEATTWHLPEDSVLWFQTDTTNYEGVQQSRRADDVPRESEVQVDRNTNKRVRTHLGPPVTVAFSDGTFGLITEASLYNYSGMTLRPEGNAKFQAVFQDDPEGWSLDGEIRSPWRVVLLTRDLNALVNNDIIPALCDAPDPHLFPKGIQTEWIRPGKAPCTWMVHGNSGARWDRQKWFVDMAAATACEYLLVDAGWRTEQWGWLKDGADPWARAAELCRYAAERNVGIVLWHSYVEGRDDGPGLTTIEAREDFFANCQKAGVKGVKIDFFDSESKETVEAYEDLLRRSAKHQLMVNFHGANKPTGEARTWPHEVTREGIREQEYLLWDSLPLQHYGALPFTRLVAGHGDFLPGYVQSRFLKNTTVIFQMASVIVLGSPFLCWPDNPEAYLHSPLLQFVRNVPTTWDETRVLPGSAIGERVLMARRKGDEWYVAGLNCGAEPRKLTVDLSLIDAGNKEMILYRDGPTRDACELAVSAATDSTLEVPLKSGGGFIAHLRPKKKFSGWK